MSAYVILRIKADDPALLKGYQQAAPAVIEQYQGQLIVRGGEVVSLEGPEEQRRIVVIEFPSLQQAEQFYRSDEYQHAIELRKEVAEFEVIAVEGLGN